VVSAIGERAGGGGDPGGYEDGEVGVLRLAVRLIERRERWDY
jgi:hypothetical protein